MSQLHTLREVVVVGAGSAGLLAALALKRHLPQLQVRVLRDPSIGVIGVGESTTPNIPGFLFGYLGISPRFFYQVANPTWKLGIHFLWGPRPHFEFGFGRQLETRLPNLPMANGFYCQEQFTYCDPLAALMWHKRAFPRGSHGGPEIGNNHAFHLYNPDFVAALERVAINIGVEITDGTLSDTVSGERGIEQLILADGRQMAADLFIDASGFRSELLGKALGEPFVSYESSLYCDRAIVGSWERTNEPILPYTTAETMDAGWCWQIEHEKQINRGYVFCSGQLTDDQARDEFLRKNPKARTWEQSVKFRSGRYQRGWVKNVIGIGNACGFVEPLEATALMILTTHIEMLVQILSETRLMPGSATQSLYNDVFACTWDEIRDFLALHYRFNTRLETPFWKQCCSDVDVTGTAALLELYQEHGPTGLCRNVLGQRALKFGVHNSFGLEGHLVILLGNRVPYRNPYQPTEKEWAIWRNFQAQLSSMAQTALTVEQSLAIVRSPQWSWNADAAQSPASGAQAPAKAPGVFTF